MLLHNYSTRSHLRKEIFNAKSLVSIFLRRCLSTSPETSASEVVVERKGKIHQLLVPIVGSERASWKESLRKVLTYHFFIYIYLMFYWLLFKVLGLCQGTFSSRHSKS